MKISKKDQLHGILYALATPILWGFQPLFYYLLKDVFIFEVLAYRAIWSIIFLTILIILTKKIKSVLAIIKQKRVMVWLLISSMLLTINWGIFVWASGNGYVIQASLGYFIMPIFNVLLGVILFNEQLSKLKWFATILAFIGVLYQVLQVGKLPLIAIIIAICFSLYTTVRKKIIITAEIGLWIETAWMIPISTIFLLFYYNTNITEHNLTTWMLFMIAGLLTATPLLLLVGALKRLQLSTVGLMLYINPSLQLFCGVVLLDETFSKNDLIAFSFVWIGLIIFFFDGLKTYKKNRVSIKEI